MSLKTLTRVAAAALLLVQSAATAQPEATDAGASGSQSVSFGTTTIDGKQWQRLAYRPEIPLGKLAIALDFELFLNDEGAISSKGWEFGNSAEIANTIYRKIYYIRYGQPRDPVFFKVGALDDVTLGYGFLMSHYRNTLDYPGVKNLGLRFALNPVMGLNVEGMMNNFLDISEGGPVAGLRIAKPWGPFEVGVSAVYDFDQYGALVDSDGDDYPDALDRFPDDKRRWADTDNDGIADEFDRDVDGDALIDIDFGGTVIDSAQRAEIDAQMGDAKFDWDLNGAQRQQLFNKKSVGNDPFGMVGADAAFKIIDRSELRFIVYAQAGMSLDDEDGSKANGWGVAAPGLLLAAGPFEGRIEYRHLKDSFMPEYFDNIYDHARAVPNYDQGTVRTKDAILDALDGQTVNGVFGDATLRLGAFARIGAQYQYLKGDETQQRLVATAGLGQTVLQAVPKLSRLEAFYTKRNIGLYDDDFFERTVDMMYGYNVGFELGGGVEVVWSTRWLFEPTFSDPTEVTANKQVTLATVVRF